MSDLPARIVEAEPATYARHAVHDAGRSYPETNCYTDIIVELLHARGYEPLGLLGCTLQLDFEGDQWTFFKPEPNELLELYGVDVHEMQPASDLPRQIAAQLDAGRTMTVEVDSWFLPDVAATAYRTGHVKSSIAVAGIDPAGERLRYFHNSGLFELSGEDFRGVFRLDGRADDLLPPYTELVRFDVGAALAGEELRDAARAQLTRHLAAGPQNNPFVRFGASLEDELPRLLGGSLEGYHAYAFATVRMAGSGFELASSYVDWLFAGRNTQATAAFDRLVAGCKLLSFKLARRRPFDLDPHLQELADAWDVAHAALVDRAS